MNNIYLVMREKDNVVVSIMLNKSDHTYSFVNLTKGHICTCKFATFEDAIKDMEEKKDNGEVIDYIKLLWIIKKELILKRFLNGKISNEI